MRREAVGLLIIASIDLKTCEKQLVFNTLQLLATKQKLSAKRLFLLIYSFKATIAARSTQVFFVFTRSTALAWAEVSSWPDEARTWNRGKRLRQTRTSRSRVFGGLETSFFAIDCPIPLYLPIDLYCLFASLPRAMISSLSFCWQQWRLQICSKVKKVTGLRKNQQTEFFYLPLVFFII